jgi:hypothetical protein
MVSSTILVAASEHLTALKQHEDLADAEAFADTDALKALEVIARTRPSVIALARSFAASARGAAFINRLKADPALASCAIRILDAGGGSRGAVSPPAAAATSAATVAAVAAPAGPSHGQTDMRRAERFVIEGNIEVQIDGSPATLVNISVLGAQVMSPSALRPNQRVRMSLLESARPIRFNGIVAWATFEMPKEGPRYRAGISFFDAAPDAVARFIETVTRS